MVFSKILTISGKMLVKNMISITFILTHLHHKVLHLIYNDKHFNIVVAVVVVVVVVVNSPQSSS